MKHGRLIDANALMPKLKFIREAEHQIYGKESWGFASKCITAVEDAPTIEERKTGKWIEQDDGWDGVYYECSVCKEAFTLIDGNPSNNLYNFCPNCGAKMEV